ncbi:hypothetical protein PMAYCL1PPCAC_16329, partial [Pristionchus mayeri]
ACHRHQRRRGRASQCWPSASLWRLVNSFASCAATRSPVEPRTASTTPREAQCGGERSERSSSGQHCYLSLRTSSSGFRTISPRCSPTPVTSTESERFRCAVILTTRIWACRRITSKKEIFEH